ncbi:hypothetical protein Tco_0064604 [Tanacetum coccineum]
MSTLKYAETYNLVAFLEKPEESNGVEEIIDFLNASFIQYALTVNLTIYTTCIEQFWTSAKLDDAEGTDCLPTATIFAELERMGTKTTSCNEFSSTMAFAIICLATNQKFNLANNIFDKMVKNLDGGTTTEETTPEEHVSTPSYDPPPSGVDIMQLAGLMSLCTNLQEKVFDLEKAKTAQANEITSLKKRVKQLEKRRKSKTSGLRRLRKVGSSSRVESFNDASLGAQEDASKQGRKIEDLDADAEATLVNETQEMNDDNLMFDIGVLEEQEIEFEKVVEEPVVSVATTTKSIPVSAAEVVTTANASVEEHIHASTKPFSSSQSQLPQVKDKGKGKMVEPEVPLKKKDQVALDE